MAHSEPNFSIYSSTSGESSDDFAGPRNSSFSGYDPTNRLSGDGSPMMMSPWNQSPFAKSPWSNAHNTDPDGANSANAPQTGLIGSLVREEGHIYSLAAKNDCLYTGSDSKNIRVWKNMNEFSAFKSNSGLVKAIIISGDKIFTGHQDGKVRVWKVSPKNPSVHKRVGTMPAFFDIFKASMRPKNYVEVKRKRTGLWIKHTDAISCLSMNDESGFLYSASWDRTFKVWKVDNSKCVESVKAHDDAVNCVVASKGGMVYTGSADGTVKVWRRRGEGGKSVKHACVQTPLKQECAVTALAVSGDGCVVYCGSSDGVVNFWERDEKKEEEEEPLRHGGVLKGHKLAVLCLEAAGSLVLSGSADKTICVWRRDGAVHSCVSVLTGHNGPVKCLAVEKDKEGENKWVVYSGSLDKSVKVWSVSEVAPDVQHMQMGMGDNFNWENIPSVKY